MKRSRWTVAAFLLLFTACDTCGSSGPRGATGQLCRSDGTTSCDTGLICNGVNHCVACGALGQPPCVPYDSRTLDGCNAGLHGSHDVCRVCGDTGQTCCFVSGDYLGTCAGDNSCDLLHGCVSGAPPAPTPGPCAGGSSMFRINCQDANGCGRLAQIGANDSTGAEECARSQGCSIVEGVLDSSMPFCIKPPHGSSMMIDVPAFSADSGLACARSMANVGDIVTAGDCPTMTASGP